MPRQFGNRALCRRNFTAKPGRPKEGKLMAMPLRMILNAVAARDDLARQQRLSAQRITNAKEACFGAGAIQ